MFTPFNLYCIFIFIFPSSSALVISRSLRICLLQTLQDDICKCKCVTSTRKRSLRFAVFARIAVCLPCKRIGHLFEWLRVFVRKKLHPLEQLGPGGTGSEVWNQVYMIASVKKFGRVRLSATFLENKYGGECRHGRTMSFCWDLSFPTSKDQEEVSMNFSSGPFGHQEA